MGRRGTYAAVSTKMDGCLVEEKRSNTKRCISLWYTMVCRPWCARRLLHRPLTTATENVSAPGRPPSKYNSTTFSRVKGHRSWPRPTDFNVASHTQLMVPNLFYYKQPLIFQKQQKATPRNSDNRQNNQKGTTSRQKTTRAPLEVAKRPPSTPPPVEIYRALTINSSRQLEGKKRTGDGEWGWRVTPHGRLAKHNCTRIPINTLPDK